MHRSWRRIGEWLKIDKAKATLAFLQAFTFVRSHCVLLVWCVVVLRLWLCVGSEYAKPSRFNCEGITAEVKVPAAPSPARKTAQ
jgi:hypothetical protein